MKEDGVDAESLQKLFVIPSVGSPPCIFVDDGVYSRNRNFRILLSSKIGKDMTLRRHKNCQFFGLKSGNLFIAGNSTGKKMKCNDDTNAADMVDHVNEDEEKFYFTQSLVSNVEYSADIRWLIFPISKYDTPQILDKFEKKEFVSREETREGK